MATKVNGLEKRRILFSFGLKQRIRLYERLAAFLDAGIPIFEAVEAIKRRLEKKKSPQAAMFNEWLNAMRGGVKFSEAIKDWIPSSEYMLISSGDVGKGLSSGLVEATKLSMASSKIKSTIIKGAAMPTLLFFILCAMVAGFDKQMVPVFSKLIPIKQWPDNAQLLYTISHFISTSWLMVLGVLGVLVFIISITMNTFVGPLREKFFDYLPPWSLYKNYQAASFLIGLSSMLQAGVALNDALRVMGRNAPPWLKVHISRMMSSLKSGGGNYGDALNTGLFDDELAGDISDYSRLSSFENAVFILGERMIEDSVESTDQKMKVAQQLMLFLVAGTIGWIYGTSYSLQELISEKINKTR